MDHYTDAPVMGAAEACKAKVKYFIAKMPCKVCGDKRRWNAGFSLSDVACATCEPETGVVTSGANVMCAEESHNRKVRQKQNKLWVIPTVYRGTNFSKR